MLGKMLIQRLYLSVFPLFANSVTGNNHPKPGQTGFTHSRGNHG
jgi:hypothetical protein